MTNVRIYILAGGQGTRFWPLSRAKTPKQFLPLGPTDETLLRATVARAEKLSSRASITIVTSKELAEKVDTHVSGVNIIAEPIPRNTAASIGLAALDAMKHDPEGVCVVLPADHAVAKPEQLIRTIRKASEYASRHDRLVTIGIRPSRPHTGYGYIKRGKRSSEGVFEVDRFFEKPNLERAISYCDAGEYLWNSGMFVWKAAVIWRALEESLPALVQGLSRISAAPQAQWDKVAHEVFSSLESISIDFGVLEHAKNCSVVEAEDFGWNDVGSWDAWAEQFGSDEGGNVVRGEAFLVECEGCTVRTAGADEAGKGGGEGRVTALLGVKDLVVIDSGDALLICSRDRTQDVKKMVELLKTKGKNKFI